MTLNLGEFPFLNCMPIYYALKRHIIKGAKLRFTVGPPSKLNQLLKEGKTDVSLISSIACLDLAEDCYILPDLSISSYGAVKSVMFFSHLPYHRLDGAPVYFTSKSATSIALLKLILKRCFNVSPIYLKGELKNKTNMEIAGGLAIGDDALCLGAEGIYPYQLDLGKAWYEMANLPFVFGVFAIRKEILDKSFEITKQIWQSLLFSKNWGLNHLEELANICVNKLNWKTEDYIDYWSHLNYDLKKTHLDSLCLFFRHLEKMCEIKSIPRLMIAHLKSEHEFFEQPILC